jgi:hypothetical protein
MGKLTINGDFPELCEITRGYHPELFLEGPFRQGPEETQETPAIREGASNHGFRTRPKTGQKLTTKDFLDANDPNQKQRSHGHVA